MVVGILLVWDIYTMNWKGNSKNRFWQEQFLERHYTNAS